ncbi:subtilisin-like protease [Arthroderma uncinatum]|uniref:subtilisin-like protease n=1 Tax=Arthroderma uncinatum TaxID=74035 RepID=UPI00144AEDC3|nr:subtilisin-like protease [Arthroderma uncinatum]KAF3480956.1 subtilisin-like protease [Arthroderma uncinatum]
MKVNGRRCLLTVALLLFGVRAAEIVPAPRGMEAIPDSYLVVMKDGILANEFDTHKEWIGGLLRHGSGANEAGEGGWGVQHTFNIAGLQGYSGNFDRQIIQKIAHHPKVKHVEQDAVVRALGLVTQKDSGWHLSRISHKILPPNPEYVYEERAGKDVHIYLLDTGVDGTNSGLRGRVIQGINTTPDGDGDESGHGTSIAEIMAGTVHGVAKKALVVSVKILGNTGSGTLSGIIQGLDWSINDVAKRGIVGKAVMNMSFGGSYSSTINQATEKVIKAGIFVAASVGAGNRDASGESPVSANGVCAVAASTIADGPALFSSYGPIVDIYAPGTNITTRTNGDRLVTVSGSSFSTAQVSGVAAFAIDIGVTSDKVCETIKKLALPSIQNPRPGTTNLLLYNGSGR